jgi:SnoaL-like domain
MNAQRRSVRPSQTTNGDGFRYRGDKRSLCRGILDYPSHMSSIAISGFATQTRKDIQMSKAEDNKAIVGRWFTEFWGKTCSLGVVDELAVSDMLLQYSLHEPRRGRDDIKAFMTDFRRAFPRSQLLGHGGFDRRRRLCRRPLGRRRYAHRSCLSDFLMGSLPPATGRKMHFTGTTVLRIQNGKITQEIGLDDGVRALTQLGLIKGA